MTEASTIGRFEAASIATPSISHFPSKRLFDLVFSTLVLTLGFPVFLIIACAIMLSSRGLPVYSHERIGRGGKAFRCYKFRTMYRDADARLESILEQNPSFKAEWLATRKLRNDPRITPLGHFLRKTSLDELPQFWNVLKGDLSVVGPRPVVRDEVIQYLGHRANKILSIRPGLTGIWQVSGRSDTSYETRMRLDEQYVDTHCFSMDLLLILQTIPSMLMRRGAY